MRGVNLPPEEEDFTADPVELFFDLAFVFAFSRLVYHLVHHPDWTGVGEFALLFMMIWLPWSQFTWSANAVAGNQRPVRALFLVGTVASVPMAASVTTAFGDGGSSFVIPLGLILLLGLVMMLIVLPEGHEVRSSLARYSAPNIVAVAIMIVGSFLDRELRIGFWIAALAVVGVAMVMAGSQSWLVRPGHFAERHGLIIIVALGEVIVALTIPLVETLESGEGLPGDSLAALIGAGAFAALLWWAYFDRVNRALEHRHTEQPDQQHNGRYARDVWTSGHIPIVAGIILMAAGVEEVALHPKDALPEAFRWMLVGGLLLFFAGIAGSVWRAYRVLARERLLGGVIVAAIVALAGGSMDALWLIIIVDVALVLVLFAEHVRIEGPRNGDESAPAADGSASDAAAR